MRRNALAYLKTTALIMLGILFLQSSAFALPAKKLIPEKPRMDGQKTGTNLRGGVSESVEETKLELDLRDLGITLAHRTVTLPARVAKVDPGSKADTGNIQKDDLITKLEADQQARYVTLERDGKIYRAVITKSGAPLQPLPPPQPILIERSLSAESDVARNAGLRPLRIYISAGGGRFLNSFNGSHAKQAMLMELADSVAEAAKQISPGQRSKVNFSVSAQEYSSQYNGANSTMFVKDALPRVQKRTDPTLSLWTERASHGLTLSPAKLRIGLGGSRRDGASVLGFVFESDCHRTSSDNSLNREVFVALNMGGSKFVNSWNNNPDAIVLVNQFLDRLTKKIRPEVLVGIDQINWGMGGSWFENSFND